MVLNVTEEARVVLKTASAHCVAFAKAGREVYVAPLLCGLADHMLPKVVVILQPLVSFEFATMIEGGVP